MVDGQRARRGVGGYLEPLRPGVVEHELDHLEEVGGGQVNDGLAKGDDGAALGAALERAGDGAVGVGHGSLL